MKYRIICDDPERWIGNQAPSDENMVVDDKEVKRLAEEWGKSVEELMEDLEAV